MEDNGTLKWRFDVSTFRLIGRDLITDRVTALFELVKNCYDANATEVTVRFENVGLDKQGSSLSIIDNGFGMSFADIRDKWMVIGTSNKRSNPYTPLPFHRKCVGEKGIGRFAVDKLGDKVNIITKQDGEDKWLNVEIDWESYYKSSNNQQLSLFTDIENHYEFSQAKDKKDHGTTLNITNIREVWVEDDIRRFIAEVARLISPFENMSSNFQIRVIASEYGIDTIANKGIEDIKLATASFSITYNKEDETQETVFFNESN